MDQMVEGHNSFYGYKENRIKNWMEKVIARYREWLTSDVDLH